MKNAPENITMALRQRVIIPLAEVVTGRRPAEQVTDLLALPVERMLSSTVLHSRPVQVLNVYAQVLPGSGAAEVFATVDVAGTHHALACRVEVDHGRVKVVALQAPSLLT